MVTETELRKAAIEHLMQRLGREPTEEEIRVQMDVWIIDRAGGKVVDSRHGRHRRK